MSINTEEIKNFNNLSQIRRRKGNLDFKLLSYVSCKINIRVFKFEIKLIFHGNILHRYKNRYLNCEI